MNKEMVCGGCDLSEVCRIKQPQAIDGKLPTGSIDCVHFTCPSGEAEAIKVIRRNNFRPLILENGQEVRAARFGTSHKPTHEGEFERYVTPSGEIISKRFNGGYIKVGQTLDKFETIIARVKAVVHGK